MLSTFSMLSYGPTRTCHKTLSSYLFGVMQQFDSTTIVTTKTGDVTDKNNYRPIAVARLANGYGTLDTKQN